METKIRYIICSKTKLLFYKRGEFETTDIYIATHFYSQDRANYWKKNVLSSFQKVFLTEIVPIKVTIEFLS